jgi:predicted acylesterase/phospholipase RssA
MKVGLAIYAGGNHIFYILGVLKYLFERGLKVNAIGTYSAGAAILPFLVNQKFDEAPRIFGRLLDLNKQNFYPQNFLSRTPMFPHDRIYSETIEQILDLDSLKLYENPLRVIVSEFRSKSRFCNSVVGILGLFTLILNRRAPQNTPSVYLKMFRRMFSVKGEVIDLRACASKKDAKAVILGSSTIYPFIKIRQRGDMAMLDGKLSLIAPVSVLADCEHVLSIHAHPTFLPERDRLHSIFPVNKVTAGPLNYVGSAEIRASFLQGYDEGRAHYEALPKEIFFQQ